MNVLIFGATGMIGQAALRECLLAPDVRTVTTLGRSATNQKHPKLQEIVHADLWNYTPIESRLANFDACFFCLGIASAGMTETDYDRITYGITLAAAQTLARLNPQMTFIFVSGAGADSSERGSLMWARVKGKTENAILRLPFKAACVFRPGVIQPLHGIQSRTASYRILYKLTKPVLPLLRKAFPGYILTTEQIGQAMLKIVRQGPPKKILESKDIAAFISGSGS